MFLLAVGVIAAVCGGIGTIIALGPRGLGPGMFVVFLVVDFFAIGLLAGAVIILRRTKPLGSSSDGATAAYPAHIPVHHELDGATYTTVYTPPVKGKNPSPSVLTVSIPVACDGEFEMGVETWFDKLGKRIGIATELQTGDDQFDEQCYIRTDALEFTTAYLADPLKRVAILDLRQFGFLSLALKNRVLSATRINFDPRNDDRPEFIPDVGARLVLLARGLPDHQPEFDNRVGAGRKFWQVVLWVLLVGFALLVFSLVAFTPINGGDLILRALPVLLVGWPLAAVGSAWLLSGTSRSHLAWRAIMLGSVILFPVGSAGIVGLLNGTLDDSVPTTHNAVIVEKYTTRSKNTTHYHVRCPSWRKPGETESFEIRGDEYNAVVPHRSKLVVVTRGGGLSVEWMVSKRVDFQPKP